MKQIYQLFCEGNSICDWRFSMHSKRVFTQYADAEKYIPDFIELCSDTSFLDAVDPKTAKVKILTLELS